MDKKFSIFKLNINPYYFFQLMLLVATTEAMPVEEMTPLPPPTKMTGATMGATPPTPPVARRTKVMKKRRYVFFAIFDKIFKKKSKIIRFWIFILCLIRNNQFASLIKFAGLFSKSLVLKIIEKLCELNICQTKEKNWKMLNLIYFGLWSTFVSKPEHLFTMCEKKSLSSGLLKHICLRGKIHEQKT